MLKRALVVYLYGLQGVQFDDLNFESSEEEFTDAIIDALSVSGDCPYKLYECEDICETNKEGLCHSAMCVIGCECQVDCIDTNEYDINYIWEKFIKDNEGR